MVIDLAKREDQLQNHPQQAETFEIIRALIREVRQCQEAVHYRIIQQKLGQHVRHADHMAEEASIRLKRIEKQLDQLPYHKHVNDKKLECEKLELEREAAEFERHLYRRIGSQYRSVGDAMAWQPALSPQERATIKARQGVELITSGELLVVDELGNEVPHDGATLGEIVTRAM